MSRAGWRLSVSRALKIHRGEETRIFSFLLLHILLSIVIGMISTVVDPLIITHRTTGSSAMMYGVAAFVLGGIGVFYAGITDRVDKRRLFAFFLLLSFFFCTAAGALLFIHDFLGELPFLLPTLFVWRFVVGILLLLIFWDLAPFYFDARQGKRLFPLLAIGGAMGYSGGSLIVVPLARVLPVGFQLLSISVITLLCLGSFYVIRSRFTILDSPRYRNKSISEELREGAREFGNNDFLRAVGWNTVVFGILSGLIILTYNAVINARTTTGTEAASVMGLQRAVVTVLQAVVLTKVMSQSQLGGKHKNAVVMQVLFFVLGIMAFMVSMVGVADFTRQIEVALMSPAAMAAFAFLPSQYRGRVMVLNNIVAAALGILVATILVMLSEPYVDPLWFIYPIAVLMIVRLAFNFVLNRRYVALLSENMLSKNNLNLARFEENTGSILQDETLLQRLYEETRTQNQSIRVFITSRLARAATTAEEIERITPFFRSAQAEEDTLEALRIQTLARVDFDRYKPEIAAGKDSPYRAVRVASRLATLERQFSRESSPVVREQTKRLQREFAHTRETSHGTDASAREESFREIVEIILALEKKTGVAIIESEEETLRDRQRELFLEILADNPSVRYLSLLVERVHEASTRSLALKGLRRIPEEELLEHRSALTVLNTEETILLLQEMQHTHPALTRHESSALLEGLLRPLPGKTAFAPGNSLFSVLLSQADQIIAGTILFLADPAPAPARFTRLAGEALREFTSLFPHLFALRFFPSWKPPGTGERSRFSPLFLQFLDEQIRSLSVLSLGLLSITMTKEDDRILARSICSDLRERSAPVKQNALEFIETRAAGDIRKYLLLAFESLTEEEKRAQLESILKGKHPETGETFDSIRAHFGDAESDIHAEILENVREEIK